MRWKYQHPRNREERTRAVFALFPRRANDGYTYWLCRVAVTERYIVVVGRPETSGWIEVRVAPYKAAKR